MPNLVRLLVYITATLSLHCSTLILNREEETLSLGPVSHSYRLDVDKTPSTEDPTVAFTATRVDTVRKMIVNTTVSRLKPNEYLEYGLIISAGLCVGVALNSQDFPDEQLRRTAGAVSVASIAAFVVTEAIANIDRRRIEHTRDVTSESHSCAVMIRANDKDLGIVHPSEADCRGSFDLTQCIDSLPSDRDVDLTLTVCEAQEVSRTVTMPQLAVAELRKQEAERREAARKAEEEAGIEAERQQAEDERQAAAERRKEEAEYRPLTLNAAVKQWNQFRTNEKATEGTVTTWVFKVHFVDDDLTGYLEGFDYPVLVTGDANCGINYREKVSWEILSGSEDSLRVFPAVHENDWIVVTGAFSYISSDGTVVMNAIRVKNEGYRE